jgi:hypothetical protein
MADPPSCGELACDAGEVHDRTNLAPVRTQAPSPTGSGAGFVAALSDGWTASGPFRAAPMGYVLHNGTPAGTPLASPRHTAGQGDDLEAPLLAANRSGGLKAEGSAGSAALKAMTFGVINTCAGVVRPAGVRAATWHACVVPAPTGRDPCPTPALAPCACSPPSSPFAPSSLRTQCMSPGWIPSAASCS